MKKNLLSYVLIAMFSLFIFSCNDDNDPGNIQKGEVEFGFSLKDISQTKSKSLKADVEPAAIVVSIKDAMGTLVYDMEEIDLFNMNDYFISKPLSLLVGTYSVEKFFVIDAEGNVIYASPLEDSDLAYLVSEPLPIEFNVSKDETLKLVPEVLSTEILTPEDFGYTTFSFDIVETFDFLLSVFVYNETNENFELTDAILSILANETTIYTDSLLAITNQIKVNDGLDSYILTVEKEGYTAYVDTFTNEELKLYFSNEDNGPLTVILENVDLKSISFVTDQSTLSPQIIFGLEGMDDLNLILDWGDESPTELIAYSPDNTIHEFSHTYSSQGQYQISILGNVDIINYFQFNNAQLISTNLNEATNLLSLYIKNNNLSTIDISNNSKLSYLYCGENNMTSLDISQNHDLITLDCRDNALNTVDVSDLPFLKYFTCYENNLINLDVTNNPNLVTLWCRGNQISSIDLSNNLVLENLEITANNLYSIDISNNTNLWRFGCNSNNLSSIDISNNPYLLNLSVEENYLTSIDISNNTELTHLYCDNNQLSDLNVSNNAKLTLLSGTNNNFDSTAINQILSTILTHVTANPYSGGMFIQRNQPPTNQGLIDKNELIITYGWTVATSL